MRERSKRLGMTILALVVLGGAGVARAEQPRRGPQRDTDWQLDRELFLYLVDHRGEIDRQVKQLNNGVETVTESDNPAVAAKIQQHVERMKRRVEQGPPIRMRDPLFAELFRHADKISLKVERTDHGMRVRETSDDEQTVRLIQAHAAVVTQFLENGRPEVRANHAVPQPSGN